METFKKPLIHRSKASVSLISAYTGQQIHEMLICIFTATVHAKKPPTQHSCICIFGIKNHTLKILLALLTPAEKGQNSRNYLPTQRRYQI